MIRSHDHHFFEVLEILGYAGHHKWYSKLFELHFPMKHLSYCFETSPECLFFHMRDVWDLLCFFLVDV